MHPSHSRWPIAAAAILACACFAATAAALVSTSGATTQLSIMNVSNDGATRKTTPGWSGLPGATRTVTVPAGGAVINARLAAQSRCGGPAAAVCSVRIKANGLEWAPQITSPPFAFDSVAASAGGGGGNESHLIERSLTLPPGTYKVHVALNVTPGAQFAVSYWHFAVETSAP